ncbi:uncharacterized protein [Amphiura filiformis]|uniref:uncharacterized protein isoform X2 n=1 Tax=Amphiura filiformis TaxID=82378 RepID=UPI003B212421
MIRSAALCLILAAAILPDLVAAQQNSDWNRTGLEDAALIGIIVAAVVLFIIICVIVAVCCCCFMCPGTFGSFACCGPSYVDEPPYFEPPPTYYPPQPPPEPQAYPLVLSQPQRPDPEPVYYVKPDYHHEPRRESQRVYIVRDDYDREYRDYGDVERRVGIRRPTYHDDHYHHTHSHEHEYPRRYYSDYRGHRSSYRRNEGSRYY